ncbi:MAG: alpha/beta fold hydrolase [Verrucomicrobia bacterium]|nr:alpha/beta fold hydrolase [Verrucomicrobiota bacterium]MBU6446396.1 alpha/beta fold hydrolase [Verrucomicrobiota bacterium]MDE3047599.1 alpha/beta fold hydrolase [Verrucomicrobiota bacterium]
MLTSKKLNTGKGIPIVFLHGLLGRAEDWIPVCSHLPDHTCIGIDLPGHGDSPFEPEWSIDLPQFHLVGYSLGGRIALQLFRHRARSLTLLSTHPGLNTLEEKQARWQSDLEWARLLLELPIDEFLKRWYDQSIFKPYQPDFATRRNQNVEGVARALMHYSLAKQERLELDGVLVGERDEKFRALYQRSIVIPHAGHMIHLENPKAVAEIIRTRVEP